MIQFKTTVFRPNKAAMKPAAIVAGLNRAAAKYKQLQDERLARGVDVHGAPFKPYSKKWDEKKRAAGRMEGNYWLKLTEGMLRSQKATIVFSGTKYILRIGFVGLYPSGKIVGSRDKRALKKDPGRKVVVPGPMVEAVKVAEGNNRKRQFVGFNASDIQILQDVIFQKQKT